MFEVYTGLLFSSSSFIIPQLCLHMVLREKSRQVHFLLSAARSSFRVVFQLSRCATSQPAVGPLCFHNNHSILNYHFPPPLFFNFFLLLLRVFVILFQLFSRVLFSGRALYKFENHCRCLVFPLLILE